MKRYDQYSSALSVLASAGEQDLGNEFVQSGVIDKFALQFELGWKMLKDLLRYEGETTAASGSPRDVLKAAWRSFGFLDEDVWLNMLRDRNAIMHLYDAGEAQRLVARVLDAYIPAFEALRASVEARYGADLDAIP